MKVAALIWVALLTTALIAREPPLSTVEGQVVAKESGRAIPGARVEARGAKWEWGRTVKADAQGRFRLEGVPAGAAFFAGSGKVHQMEKEQWVFLREGAGNSVTMTLEPVAPFLRLGMAQHVLTPDETPALTCSGYTTSDNLTLAVRRFPLSALRNRTESPYTPYDENLTVPATVGEMVHDATLPADPKDVEGALRRKIVLPALPPGLYSLWVNGKDAKAGAVFSVSNIGLVTKTAARRVLGYVVDLKSGRPVPGAAMSLFHRADVVASGATDSDGLFQTTLSEKPTEEGALVAQSGDSVAFTRAERSYGAEEDGEDSGPLRVYLYTDRPIYRPGHTVNYKGIVRRRVGATYRLPSARTAEVEIRSPSGALLERRRLDLNDMGSYHGEFRLAPEAEIGAYSVATSFGRGESQEYQPSSYFHVAEYRKPEYLVTVEPVRKQYVRGERVEFAISASYFWGGPVKEAEVTYTVYREPYWGGSEEEGDPLADYYAAAPFDHKSGEEILHGEARTNTEGRLSIGFETASRDTDSQDYVYRVEAEVTEAGRMSVSGSGRVVVSRGTFRLEVQPERAVISPGESVRVVIRAINLDGTPRAAAVLEVTIRGKTERISTDARGRAVVQAGGPVPGAVEIRVAGTDERGNRIVENGWVWIARGAFSDPNYNYAALEIVADRKRYRPGETAKLVIQTSKPGGAALLTVEGRELYHARVVPLAARTTLVTVPIEPAHVPNVFVTVTTIHGKTYSRQEARLQVSPEDHTLQVTVTPDRQRYGPRQTVTYTVRTADLHGRPVAAEASLGLVDESIYAIMPDPPLDSLETFYGFQENRVNTAFSFPEIYLAGDAKDAGPSEVRRDFPDTATWLPVIRTGSNGRAVVRVRLPDTLTTWRATVRAHTAATQVGTGIAKVVSTKPLLVRLEAPRFFTQKDETLVSAVVHNETDRPQRVTVSLQTSGLTLRDADRATLEVPAGGLARHDWRAGVNAAPEATLLVRAVASPTLRWNTPIRRKGGVERGDPLSYQDAVELKKPIVAHGVEDRHGIAGEVTGTAGSVSLTLRPGAIRAATTCRVTITGSPAGIMLQALDFLHASNLNTSENAVGWFLPDMTVAMSLRELGMAPAGVRHEALGVRQGASGARSSGPNAQRLTPNASRLQDDAITRLFAELPRRVRDNLARLYRLQKPDGGWSWGESGEPDAFWTAYVLYGLHQARRAGYLVDADVVSRGVQSLHTLLPRVRDSSNRALMLYVLAQVERPLSAVARRVLLRMAEGARSTPAPPPPSDSGPRTLVPVAPEKQPLQNYARALLALALADAGQPGIGRAVALTLNGSCKETERYAQWPEIFPWGFYSCNDNETTGYAMTALIRLDPTNRRIAKGARWLMARRSGDGWASTEDTASVIYALAAYMRHVARSQPADYIATVRVNGATAGEVRVTRRTMFQRLSVAIPTNLLREGANAITIEKAGPGPLLYSALLETRLEGENLPARSSGFTLTREYVRRERKRNIHGHWETRDIPLGGAVRSGDVVLVKLTVNARDAAREVVLRDSLPAGCEGVAQSEEEGYFEGEYGYGASSVQVRDRTVTITPWLLRKGVNHFEYRMQAQIPGDYHVLPAEAGCAYIPDIWGASPETHLTVRD